MISTTKQYFIDLHANLPSRIFWLGNALFWLVLNTLAASNTYRVRTDLYDKDVDFIQLWLQYIPFWGNWILVAPFIIASTSVIKIENNNIKSFVLKNILATSLFLFFYWFLTLIEIQFQRPEFFNIEHFIYSFHEIAYSLLHIDFLVYLAIFGVGYAASYYRNAKNQEHLNQQLEKQIVEVELHSLKSQLNPHFLFNALNTISSLIRLEQKKVAIKAISELSLMLRKVLENQNKQMIPLADELEFINCYLAIQQLRFENKLIIKMDINDHCLTNDIPFMLLQTLVENAVQHGSQLESNENYISLMVDCDEEKMMIRLINIAAKNEEHHGFGIGFNNCKTRMEKLYGDHFDLTLKALDDDYFETFLTIPHRDYYVKSTNC